MNESFTFEFNRPDNELEAFFKKINLPFQKDGLVYNFPTIKDSAMFGELLKYYQITSNPDSYQGYDKQLSDILGEKKVLKIKTDKKEEMPQGGVTNNQMPPMDNPQPQIGSQMPPMDDMDGEQTQSNDEQFDADFDAGVEADENSDPKRYIQQLAGKLSQSLRKYNEGLPNPDVDLNKYVAGMANDAAVEGLSPEDVEEIISKIKSDENSDSDNQDTSQDNVDTPPMGNNQDMSQNPEMSPMENKKYTKKLTENLESYIDEIVNDIILQKPNNVNNDKIKVNKSFKTKPYTSPMFK